MDLILAAETVTAEITTGLIFVGIAIALAFAAKALYKAPSNPGQRQPFTTLTGKGTILPIVIGRRLVGPAFAWVGDRYSRETGGGKGFGGGGSGGSLIFREAGWHVICVGPMHKLHAIYANGTVVWEGPISSTDTPSGTRITSKIGNFWIYWGEEDQPVNEKLGAANRIGIMSRWPFHCYVHWDRKLLGGSPSWEQLEYDIESCPASAGLQYSSYRLEDSSGNAGVNPASALLQILNAPFPQGRGVAADNIDNDSLEDLGILCDTEELPVNLLIEGGSEAAAPVQALMQDIGFMMPQVGKRLVFVPWRSKPVLPVLDDDIVMPPDTEIIIPRGDLRVSRGTYIFDNLNDAYAPADIKFDDDWEAEDTGDYNQESIRIATAVTYDIANKIARRRSLEEVTRKRPVKVQALRGARVLVSGQQFSITGIGDLVVLSSKVSDEGSSVELDCVLNYFFRDVNDNQSGGGSSGGGSDADEDIAFTWVQIPDTFSIIVFRVRAHDAIDGAVVWASADGSAYREIGEQNTAAAGGLLLEGIDAATDEVIASGPTFEPDNFDYQDIADLSGDDVSWRAGQQLALINDEIFYVQSVEVVDEDEWDNNHAYTIGDFVKPNNTTTSLRYEALNSGTSAATLAMEPPWPNAAGQQVVDNDITWEARHFSVRLLNLIRARRGTAMAAHVAGDRVFIIEATDLSVLEDVIIQPGVTLCVKTQPYTSSDEVEVAGVSAVCKTITGAAEGDANLRIDSDGNYRVTDAGDYRTTE